MTRPRWYTLTAVAHLDQAPGSRRPCSLDGFPPHQTHAWQQTRTAMTCQVLIVRLFVDSRSRIWVVDWMAIYIPRLAAISSCEASTDLFWRIWGP